MSHPGQRLRVLIADDEQLARKRLSRLLAALPEVELVAECASGEEVLARLSNGEEVDVCLLDIQMPGLTGLDVSGLLDGGGPRVIFTTAHPEHALEAFDLGAADYLLKPVEAARLRQALERVRPFSRRPAVERLALDVRGEVRLLDPAAISHALFDGQLVTVYVEGEALLTDLPLQELERRCGESAGFLRVHRRALLNLAHVERLQPLPTGGYLAVTLRGDQVPVSRQVARELRRRLGLS